VWSAPRPGRFTSGKDPAPIVNEARWAPGPVWTCAKYLTPTGIRSLDRPARSQSLYRLSYPAHQCSKYFPLYVGTGNLVPNVSQERKLYTLFHILKQHNLIIKFNLLKPTDYRMH
jgi:hypothetical protein